MSSKRHWIPRHYWCQEKHVCNEETEVHPYGSIHRRMQWAHLTVFNASFVISLNRYRMWRVIFHLIWSFYISQRDNDVEYTLCKPLNHTLFFSIHVIKSLSQCVLLCPGWEPYWIALCPSQYDFWWLNGEYEWDISLAYIQTQGEKKSMVHDMRMFLVI